MRKYQSPDRGQPRIFAVRAAGRLSTLAARGAGLAVGAVRHAAWYATYLLDGRRGARGQRDVGD